MADGRFHTAEDSKYSRDFLKHLERTMPKIVLGLAEEDEGVNFKGDVQYGGKLQENHKSPVPTDAEKRKKTPVWSGFVKYFPRAIVAISQVSQAGNDQHNPGQPLHWDKEKSKDHFDTAMRHGIDHLFNPVDTDGQLHLAKMGWRSLAALETYLEEQHAGK